jgi:hypothetical protein
MALEELLLNEFMEAFVGKVDGKLVEGIGLGMRFWVPGRSNRAMKVTKSSRQKRSLMCSLSHENRTTESRVSSQGCTVIGCAIQIKEDCTELLLLDELGLVREHSL